MPKKTAFLFLFLALVQIQCKSQTSFFAYNSETLKIIPVSEHSFVHVSYLNTTEYGKVPCNGLINISNNEAIVFDTPTSPEVSKELLRWLVEDKKTEVMAVVINHFHIDCLGGLEAFHESGIASYATNETIRLARKDGLIIPQNGFDRQNELEVGGKKIINRHFGEAHTSDNIISYVPNEELIFGGCMIKSLNGQKGNLNDANVSEWSNTVRNIKTHYPNLKIIVPGHGKYGGAELLDYTIELFKTD
ncbi:MAG: subclass B1 metallo-beta-lactamase [Aurantibacter sp.]